MNKTKIEWVKNPDGTQGYTWNPITGCLNHTPEGLCLGGMFPCFAFKLANGRLKNLYLANTNYPESARYIRVPFYPRFWPKRIPKDTYVTFKQIDKVRDKPKGIFVCDMGELFGGWIPEDWQEQIFRVITFNPWHRFYLLTKQAQNLGKFSPFPDNCWVGVTATGFQAFADAHYYLSRIEAKIKFLSFEPLLFWGVGASPQPYQEFSRHLKECCNWVIIGAQTNPYKPPQIEWVEEIVRACDKAGIPVFLKDNLKPLLTSSINGKDVIESHNLWAFKYFKLRQEMPNV